jgi:hypothetical protein
VQWCTEFRNGAKKNRVRHDGSTHTSCARVRGERCFDVLPVEPIYSTPRASGTNALSPIAEVGSEETTQGYAPRSGPR